MIGEGGFDWAEDFGFDASVFAELREEMGGASAALSEVEIVTFDDQGWVVLLDDLVEEGFGFHREEVRGWAELDDLVGSCLDKTLFPDAVWVDLGGGLIGVEDGHGVGMEAQDEDSSRWACLLTGPVDEHLVSEMDAVVVADGQGGDLGHVGVYQGGVG